MIPELRIVPLWRVPVEPSSACLLYIDQQKAQACKESGRVLQTLVDSDVEVHTVQGRPLSDVYSWVPWRATRQNGNPPVPCTEG